MKIVSERIYRQNRRSSLLLRFLSVVAPTVGLCPSGTMHSPFAVSGLQRERDIMETLVESREDMEYNENKKVE